MLDRITDLLAANALQVIGDETGTAAEKAAALIMTQLDTSWADWLDDNWDACLAYCTHKVGDSPARKTIDINKNHFIKLQSRNGNSL
ncbi:MAG: hypothetical protein AAGC93_16370 [Cyanobacteria bacterium P01_F01_bin.53]